MGLTGGPIVTAVEAVQPTVTVASAFGQGRLPQWEKGDQIPRYYHTTFIVSAVAAQYNMARLSCSARTMVTIEWMEFAQPTNNDFEFGLFPLASIPAVTWTPVTSAYEDARFRLADIYPAIVASSGATAGGVYPWTGLARGVRARNDGWRRLENLNFVLTPVSPTDLNPTSSEFFVTPVAVNTTLTFTVGGRILPLEFSSL